MNRPLSALINPQVIHRFRWLVAAILLTASGVSFADDASEPKHLKKFVRYADCEFIETAYADGDSFRVRVDGQERVLRLYFVDAPESDTRFPDRNAEQAEYFGITPEQSVEAGKVAKKFVHDLLKGKKLTVFTRWASALGSSRLPRYYAIVEADGRNLADILVEAGLARLKGKSVTLPDGTAIDDYLAHLAELETAARAAKLGAWKDSVPAKAKPVVEEEKEAPATPRWIERSCFAGLGAAGMGLVWVFTFWLRRSRQSGLEGTA